MEEKKDEFGSILFNFLDCENNCVFCGSKFKDKKKLFVTEKDEEILFNDTKHFIKNKVKKIDISGPEPLRYHNIIRYLKSIRPYFERITLLDPGNSLAEDGFARQLANTGIHNLVIPLYGTCSEVHDICVGNPGAFEKVVKGLKEYFIHKNENQNVEISTIILNQNKDDIINLPSFIKKNFNLNYLKVNLFLVTISQHEVFKDVFVSFEETKKIILNLSMLDNFFFRFDYVPLCIFSEDQLNHFADRKSIAFFNRFYTYKLSKNQEQASAVEKKTWKEFVDEYRAQVYHSACNECSLKNNQLCSGVMKAYLHLNNNYEFSPISESELKKLGH
ncbi:MAG TPA: hypothetical protein ENN46_00385, partial [Candidatus Woesearchaeota archaeon]|nr:hypothetical protein [Candidatus Woesearchaeota archaeon]